MTPPLDSAPIPSVRTVRGALVGIDPSGPGASVIPFGYNPDTLARTLQPQIGAEGGDKTEQLRLKGAPVETIKLDVEIDATDLLERGDRETALNGIYPQLAALETLVYPRSSLVIANTQLLSLGTIEVIPPAAPLTIFVWGPKRAVPVKLNEFAITEEAYDRNLNPIRAKVSLGLGVLTYDNLPIGHPGYALFLAHQVAKEGLARRGSVGDLTAVGVEGVNLA